MPHNPATSSKVGVRQRDMANRNRGENSDGGGDHHRLKTGATHPVPSPRVGHAVRDGSLKRTADPTFPGRVLVIDDSHTVRMSLREVLVGDGYEVVLAEDGQAGLRAIRAEAFDVVILDLILPDASGAGILREVKADEQLASIPVLLLTAVADRKHLVACMDLGADDFLLKPWDQNELLGRLRSMVRLKRALDASVDACKVAERASESKSRFLANMSHEIRTPMNAIMGYASILRRKLRLAGVDPQCLEAADAIHTNGNVLLELMDNILDLTLLDAGRMQMETTTCNPWAVVDGVASELRGSASDKGIELTVESDGLIPETIETDPGRLRQCLMNLVGNAVKFTSAGGVHVSVRLADAGHEPAIRFEVQDTGIGIPRGRLDMMFDMFTQVDSSPTRRFGGTGLGLAISRRIARGLGGELTVTSVEGEGSTFALKIPTRPLGRTGVTSKSIEQIERVDRPEVEKGDGLKLQGRILIAEDSPVNRALLAAMLEGTGTEIVFVEDGQAAVDAVQNEVFDVILMDWQMPVMDGMEATWRIRSAGHEVPIVALTAHAMPGDRETCLEAGCNGYLAKPVDFDVLMAELRKHLRPAELVAADGDGHVSVDA